jgi:hypothetical protein
MSAAMTAHDNAAGSAVRASDRCGPSGPTAKTPTKATATNTPSS